MNKYLITGGTGFLGQRLVGLLTMDSKNFNIHSINKYKLLKQINDAKKFNLNKNNLFTSLISTLQHESK